jgi:type III secretion protein V
MLILAMLIVPLPTWLLDQLIALNLALAVLLLITAMYAPHGLSVTSLPSVLLICTLYRLALNVSSTRLILLQADAGRVIRAFGEFVVRGEYAVGTVLFLIISLIQYIVIAKGGERVAEVAARFTLDAMPGKQLAIDSELRAGALGVEAARARRAQLERESRFYGAMDGAMKFVKGDSIAGLIITGIAFAGGTAIGMWRQGLEPVAALQLYGLLAIGDGLVSQLPALITSAAAGLLITRVASQEDGSLGQDVVTQLLSRSRSLWTATAALGMLALVPGLPFAPFAVLALAAAGTAFFVREGERRAQSAVDEEQAASALLVLEVGSPLAAAEVEVEAEAEAETADLHRGVDRSYIEPSRRDAQGLDVFNLLGQRGARRRQTDANARALQLQAALASATQGLAAQLGVSAPSFRIRQNSQLPKHTFVLYLKHLPIWRGTADDATELAQILEDQLLYQLLPRARELLSLDELQNQLDRIAARAPHLVKSVVPHPFSLSQVLEIARRLLDERVGLQALERVLEALADCDRERANVDHGLTLARRALRERLSQHRLHDDVLYVHTLDPLLEDALRDALQTTGADRTVALAPDMAHDIIQLVKDARTRYAETPLLVTQSDVRRSLFNVLKHDFPDIIVLAYPELPTRASVERRPAIGLM